MTAIQAQRGPEFKVMYMKVCRRELARSALNIMELSELWPLGMAGSIGAVPRGYLSNSHSIFIVDGTNPLLFYLIDFKMGSITLKSILVLLGHYIGTFTSKS